MPIYEFRCHDCGESFEELVGLSVESIPCPKCGSDHTGKLVSLISSKGLASGCAGCNTTSCKPSSGFK